MEEVIGMSRREINRHHIIRNVLEGKASQLDAARVLGVTDRQVRRLCARVRVKGAQGVVHQLRGRASNHQIDPAVIEKALCAMHDELWTGFGPTFARDKLSELHGITLDPETVRKLMTQVELWQPHRQGPRHRAWRERRACVGMLIQLDGSDHDWLEGRGPRFALLIYIDDATSRILHAEFVTVEDTQNLMRSTWKYLKRYGRPIALYVDKDSIYKINWAAKHESLERDENAKTQFTRAMGELGIEVITADSPQAKGRVERGFLTHQDRLVKELRLRGISTMAAANLYLWEHYVPQHNARYEKAPASNTDVHRPLLVAHRLEQILSVREQRTVMNDYTLSYEGKLLQVLEHQPVRVDPGDKVVVEIRLDGSRHLRFKDSYLNFKGIEKRPYKPMLEAQPSRGKQYDDPRTKGVGSTPAKNHPWRRLFLHGPYKVSLPANATPI
jgi:winged helix-turn helix protein